MLEKAAACLGQTACIACGTVRIHTKQICDFHKEKNCAQCLHLYPTRASQCAIDCAESVKAGKVKLLDVSMRVEPADCICDRYIADLNYYYRVNADAFVGLACPVEICGLAVYHQRVVLSDSTGGMVFHCESEDQNRKRKRPTAWMKARDPVVLGIKLVDVCANPCDRALIQIHPFLYDCFGYELHFGSEVKQVQVSLCQCATIWWERDI